MIYLDNGATSFHKPAAVRRAVLTAMEQCANPGRGGYGAAMAAANTVYHCRELAGELFGCDPDRVVFTSNCTHGLNIAINTVAKPGSHVAVSGFEHNAVTRPLHALGAKIHVAGRKLFDWNDTLEEFYRTLHQGVDAAVFTHVSNVFGYILPVEQMAAMCREQGIPFVIDAAQSAGSLPVSLRELGADFIAMPGHKGLLGPQGTGLLLCGKTPQPLLYGGTGSESLRQDMPDDTPDRVEAGTLNVPGVAGLGAGLRYLKQTGIGKILKREQAEAKRTAAGLKRLGIKVFSGNHQAGTVSFVPGCDCETAAQILARQGIAVRAGLHCAPLAHESAGTTGSGTVRVSFGHDASLSQTQALLQAASKLLPLDS
ncbi:MAG: aminotransferase class V-fold PLP-dependent enzyme [Oscillospiraceae bacterium]|nr:aminotransferase class V-fold PLP-dependent enzyme [Oscillospiraceae bacterium]